jgi:RHS repeat-associated protein
LQWIGRAIKIFIRVSCCLLLVEIKHSAEALAAADGPVAREWVRGVLREQEQVVFSLMGSFMMEMCDVFSDGVLEESFSEEDHALDASDRDIADVNVGTNGGSAFTPYTSVPSRSDTVLVTSYTYNPAGWLDETTDPRGIIAKNDYDNLGRTVATIADYTDGTPTDSTNQTTDFTYDGENHVTSMTAVLPDDAEQETQYIYGVSPTSGSNITSNDLVAATDYPNLTTGVASSGQQETYSYDALGEKIGYTDRNGNVHAYTYDTQGRLTLDAVTALGSGVDGSIRAVGTAYNTQGLPYLYTSYSDAAATTVANQVEDVYNGLEQLTDQYQSHSSAVDTSTTPEVQYGYSGMSTGSREISMTYPDGRKIDYIYSTGLNADIGRMSGIVEDATGAVLAGYLYQGLSTLIGQTDENGVTETMTLDTFGRIAEMNYVNSDHVTTDDFQYGYDADGNVLFKDNTVDPSLSELYSYDDLNRITGDVEGTLNDTDTAITGTPTDSQSWTYDALGNQIAVDTNVTTVDNTANSQNEMTANGANSLAYDNNGNTTTDENGNTLIYNAWNQLVSVKNSGGTTIASYSYDADGNRITQTEASGTEGGATTDLYLSNLGQVIEEDQGSTVTAQNVWNIDYVNDLIQRTQGTTVYYAQHDPNFSVTAMTDTSGNVLERYTYDGYGTVTVRNADGTVKGDGTIASSSIGSPYLFQGGRLDLATGLYHFGARDLDPATGVWEEQDPAGYIDGLNRYDVEDNRDVSLVDPSGLSWTFSSGWGGTAMWGGGGTTGSGNVQLGWDSDADGFRLAINGSTITGVGYGLSLGTGPSFSFTPGVAPKTGVSPIVGVRVSVPGLGSASVTKNLKTGRPSFGLGPNLNAGGGVLTGAGVSGTLATPTPQELIQDAIDQAIYNEYQRMKNLNGGEAPIPMPDESDPGTYGVQ